MVAYLNIGSNMGDRRALIKRAVALISEAFPDCGLRRSDFIESEPWGYESPHPFLNLGIALDRYEGDPMALLRTLQGIERAISPTSHRNADSSYRDRKIDIDIIAIDDLRIDTPELQLPHPRAHLRPFVAIPLAQLKAQEADKGL